MSVWESGDGAWNILYGRDGSWGPLGKEDDRSEWVGGGLLGLRFRWAHETEHRGTYSERPQVLCVASCHPSDCQCPVASFMSDSEQ